MSADNSADKPQFVENQMLTHDSLNNLVEFSAGRTKRVMKALGLGGTVSGVSWRFDQQNKIINITPGFIIFPDGEIVEIATPLTFNDIGTDGVLKYEKTLSTSTIAAPSHLCVSYEWATDGHSGKCFSTARDSYKVKLTWKQHIPSPESTLEVDPLLFQPILLPETRTIRYEIFVRSELNKRIDIYNRLVVAFNQKKILDYELTQIPRIESKVFSGIGIYGDISCELAYFAKRLVAAGVSLLRKPSLRAVGQSAITVNIVAANTVAQYLPTEIDSLLFEVFLSHKVVSDSISKVIESINLFPSSGEWPENRPQGIHARRKNTFISGVFLNTTAQVLANFCDGLYTTSDHDFSYLLHDEWKNPSPDFSRLLDAPRQLISSYSHVADSPVCLRVSRGADYLFLGFVKPYREL